MKIPHTSHIITAVLIYALPGVCAAAVLSVHTEPASIGAGDLVRVTVTIDSNVPVNAFSGTLAYPNGLFDPIAVSDGNSIITAWLAHPVAREASTTFEGITAGGFSGSGGIIFSEQFRAIAPGKGSISVRDVRVLQNDGAGTDEPTTVQPAMLTVLPTAQGGYVETADRVPPEAFSIYLGSDTELFGGKKYIVFAAADKNSGVDHYLVAESRLPFMWLATWHTVDSPYVLADQNLTSTVYVKAVDRSGNERIAELGRHHLLSSYEVVLVVSMCVLIGVIGWRKRSLIIKKP